MEVQDLFLLGMKRSIPELLPIEGPGFNLGAGRAKLKDLENLDRPNWNAEHYRIPADDSTQKAVVAFHFLEHLHDPIRMLRECQRVLQPGGVMHICVPHAMSMCAYQDLDHKRFFTEETFRNLFENPHYDTGGEWKLKVHCSFIIGVAARNLAFLAQLVRT